MTEFLNQIAQYWWTWELAIAWQIAVLIAVVAAIDFTIKRWAWPQVRYALWLLILVKLVLPPTLTSPTSFTAEIPIFAKRVVDSQITQPQPTPQPPDTIQFKPIIEIGFENSPYYSQITVAPVVENEHGVQVEGNQNEMEANYKME